ncbi:MAG: hypothetical protein V7K25_18975 [Nostoc sp.]|uniref:hypothetical protein n=1 Tax=Nostoc sp. TaxID=1180 RepID=UPI002FFBDFB3
MAIPFTDREMEKAWSQNLCAYKNSQETSRTNAHRLLLFYAVECGLKTILMKRKGHKRSDFCTDIAECQHNINKLLDCLGAGGSLNLPEIFIGEVFDTRNNKEERKLNSGQINQMWRYGGKVISIVTQKQKASDEDIENKLLAISKWIVGEIERL